MNPWPALAGGLFGLAAAQTWLLRRLTRLHRLGIRREYLWAKLQASSQIEFPARPDEETIELAMTAIRAAYDATMVELADEMHAQEQLRFWQPIPVPGRPWPESFERYPIVTADRRE